ncbi:hypothetical protein [Niveibacterium sp. SC-1]|uniref:hypothetical protein n=1 Tax=Niveibacterium sp. SC-1 TaxID=3135646 RepID=UPI00311E7640
MHTTSSSLLDFAERAYAAHRMAVDALESGMDNAGKRTLLRNLQALEEDCRRVLASGLLDTPEHDLATARPSYLKSVA